MKQKHYNFRKHYIEVESGKVDSAYPLTPDDPASSVLIQYNIFIANTPSRPRNSVLYKEVSAK